MIDNLHPAIARGFMKPKRKTGGEKAIERRLENEDQIDDDEAPSGEDIVKRAAERNDGKRRRSQGPA